MELVQLGAIGELVGGVAVLVSLVYVGVQIRQNTAQVKQDSRRGVLESYNELNRESFLADPSVAEINRRGLADFQGLTPAERYVFHLTQSEIVLHVQTVLESYDEGLVDGVYRDAWMSYVASLLRSPGASEWWEACRWTYTPSIVEALDERLRAEAGEPSYVERMPFFEDFQQA